MCFLKKKRVIQVIYNSKIRIVKSRKTIKTPKDLVDFVDAEFGVEFISEPKIVYPLNMNLESDFYDRFPCIVCMEDGNMGKIHIFNIRFE